MLRVKTWNHHCRSEYDSSVTVLRLFLIALMGVVLSSFLMPHQAIIADIIEEIARRYIELRYCLLPYLYSLFWEHTRNGLPVMRAVFLHYPKDENCY